MDLSGIIFVVLAVAWAVYLIPKALRHHDEVARTRSIDRFSSALRVLARREPVNRRDARLVVSPTRRGDAGAASGACVADASGDEPASLVVAVKPAVSRARLEARRRAARAAARRRRHILTFLLLATAATAGVAYAGRLPWWAVDVPALLTAAYLVLCRTQVRRESLHDFEVLTHDHAQSRGTAGVTEEPAVTRDTPPTAVEVVVRVDQEGVTDFDDTEDTVGIPVALLDAVAVPTEDGGSLWDPLPVTLPTYVTKPKVKRTVRTIDLGEPGTWTSGRTEEDARIVARVAQDEVAGTAADESARERAVGS